MTINKQHFVLASTVASSLVASGWVKPTSEARLAAYRRLRTLLASRPTTPTVEVLLAYCVRKFEERKAASVVAVAPVEAPVVVELDAAAAKRAKRAAAARARRAAKKVHGQ